jgi:hypothetical protein
MTTTNETAEQLREIEERDQDTFNNEFNAFAKGAPTEDYDKTLGDAVDDNDKTASTEQEIEESDEPGDGDTNQPDVVIDHEKQQLLKELESLRQLNAKLEHSNKSQVGRVSALQKKIDTELAHRLDITGTIDNEEISDLLEIYPEEASKIIAWAKSQVIVPMQDEIKTIEQEGQKDYADSQEYWEQQEYQNQIDYLNNKYGDWDKWGNSPEFSQWLDTKPPAIKSMASQFDVNNFDYLLNEYIIEQNRSSAIIDEKKSQLATDRKERLESNVTVKNTGAAKTAAPPDDFESAFNYFAKK